MLERYSVRGSDASLKVPFFLKKKFLNLNKMCQKIFQLGGFKLHGPFGLSKCPFVEQSFLFLAAKSPFPRILWFNSFILDKKGGLKSEIQINLSNIHFPFWYLMGIIYSPNDSWSQKTRAHITFMKNLASWVTLSILSKILIWNKMTFLASNSLKLAGLAVNQLKRTH